MKNSVIVMLAGLIAIAGLANTASATLKCQINMVPVGPVCVDIYEASVWSDPPKANGDPQGTQYGAGTDNYPCSDNGDDCTTPASRYLRYLRKGSSPQQRSPGFRRSKPLATLSSEHLCGVPVESPQHRLQFFGW
jgi:hypothetical protein